MHRTAARDARLLRPLAAGLGALVLALLSLGVQADDRSNDSAADRAQMIRAIEHHSARAALETGVARPDAAVLQVLGRLPRERFVPPEVADRAYEDRPLPIGYGQTISQPYIVALMIDAAEVARGGRVLEVGAGSGYAAAVMSRMAGEAFSIERHEALAGAAAERIDRLGYGNVSIIAGDGTNGLPGEAPFDAILVAAGGDKVPEPLKRQLAVGGRLVVPIGGEDVQTLLCITRTGENEWTEHDLGGVRFVPLIGEHGRYGKGSRAR